MHSPHGKNQNYVGLPYTYFMVLVLILHWMVGRGHGGCTKIFSALRAAKYIHLTLNLSSLDLNLLHCKTEIMLPSHSACGTDSVESSR